MDNETTTDAGSSPVERSVSPLAEEVGRLRDELALCCELKREYQQRYAVAHQALHEIAEEWAGAECGEPVHAQEAYAIALAKRMYVLAATALRHNE